MGSQGCQRKVNLVDVRNMAATESDRTFPLSLSPPQGFYIKCTTER